MEAKYYAGSKELGEWCLILRILFPLLFFLELHILGVTSRYIIIFNQ